MEWSSFSEGVRNVNDQITMYDVWAEKTRQSTIRILFRAGSSRFGRPSPEIEAELQNIEDFDRLDRIADAIGKAADWQEVIQTP